MNALWSRNSDLSRDRTAVLVDISSAFVHTVSVASLAGSDGEYENSCNSCRTLLFSVHFCVLGCFFVVIFC